jgi:hypothetical protein
MVLPVSYRVRRQAGRCRWEYRVHMALPGAPECWCREDERRVCGAVVIDREDWS